MNKSVCSFREERKDRRVVVQTIPTYIQTDIHAKDSEEVGLNIIPTGEVMGNSLVYCFVKLPKNGYYDN